MFAIGWLVAFRQANRWMARSEEERQAFESADVAPEAPDPQKRFAESSDQKDFVGLGPEISRVSDILILTRGNTLTWSNGGWVLHPLAR